MVCKRVFEFDELETLFLVEDLGKYRFIIINEPFCNGSVSKEDFTKFQKLEYFVSLVKKYFPSSLSRVVYIRESALNPIVYFPSLKISRIMDEIILKRSNIIETDQSERLLKMINTIVPRRMDKK
jgi:hypothetical protein